jgi:hypothetical protein
MTRDKLIRLIESWLLNIDVAKLERRDFHDKLSERPEIEK